MNAIKRTLAIATLAFFVTGCTSYRAVDWDFEDPQGDPAEALDLEKNKKVRITLKDGNRESGKVRRWSDKSLTLNTSLDTERVQETILFWDDMVALEVTEPSGGKTSVLILTGMVIVGTGIALSQMEPMGD